MKKLLILINGESGAGKDTFVEFCKSSLHAQYSPTIPVANIHRSDEAKAFLTTLGWDGTRTPKVRKLLADLVEFGEETGHNSVQLYRTVWAFTAGIIFYHSRDTKAIEEAKRFYSSNNSVAVHTVLVKRDENRSPEKDRWGIQDYTYDTVIDNNGGLNDLYWHASEFAEKCYDMLEVGYGNN